MLKGNQTAEVKNCGFGRCVKNTGAGEHLGMILHKYGLGIVLALIEGSEL